MGVFWVQIALSLGLVARKYLTGAIGSILGALTVFFIGGGLAMVRANQDAVLWIAWFFPNTYAVDPLRDLVLFNTWPVDFAPTLLKLTGFALLGILWGSLFAHRKLRTLD